MEGIFDPYVLLPFDKKLISELVMRISTLDSTVIILKALTDMVLMLL